VAGPYLTRILDAALDEFQPDLAAVSIYGPKGVGKTATAHRRAHSSLRLDQAEDLQLLKADPGLIHSLPGPLLVDEWQRYPAVWDLIRRAVDDGAPRGRFLITGSSAPRGATVHSGAGRIVNFRLRPLSLAERGVATPTVSLGALLTGGAAIGGETDVTLSDYVEEITASGLPAIRYEPNPRLRLLLLNAYIDNIVQREFPEQGYPVRRPETLRAWLSAYAAASSTTAKYSQILDAATPNQGDKPARATTLTYRDALSGLWLLDPTPAWRPTFNLLGRLSGASKHQLADPALACALLRLDAATLLAPGAPAAARPPAGRASTLLGALFESLLTLDTKVYAQANNADVHHFRDRNGDHEIDLIVEGPGGRVVALEVKLAATPDDADVQPLLWLKDRLHDDLADMAILTTGRHAYRRADGVAVIPAALLGP
jgi:predicted AAA+ superfamily ATPase